MGKVKGMVREVFYGGGEGRWGVRGHVGEARGGPQGKWVASWDGVWGVDCVWTATDALARGLIRCMETLGGLEVGRGSEGRAPCHEGGCCIWEKTLGPWEMLLWMMRTSPS